MWSIYNIQGCIYIITQQTLCPTQNTYWQSITELQQTKAVYQAPGTRSVPGKWVKHLERVSYEAHGARSALSSSLLQWGPPSTHDSIVVTEYTQRQQQNLTSVHTVISNLRLKVSVM
ncbi:hypothetical protein E5676_scaffold280G00160 [Cucumis melo var. makuwa]|uniref:Uncharacterized protein n=1 Tax=Cucumis melo var. makuwa TaxID=1194695 RepID=A0A5D3BS88_CUCMM|nr:hypothetical protein E5676_scaffold280G00160 [Cucumis melo var. makuwa]